MLRQVIFCFFPTEQTSGNAGITNTEHGAIYDRKPPQTIEGLWWHVQELYERIEEQDEQVRVLKKRINAALDLEDIGLIKNELKEATRKEWFSSRFRKVFQELVNENAPAQPS